MPKMSSSVIERELSRRSHLEFLRYTWPYKSINFLTGFHIEDACNILDKAMDDYENGISSFHMIKMPFRHHKSQTVTRSLPPHWLGRFPESDIIVGSYGQDLSNGFSRDARGLIDGERFSELYPRTNISKEASSVKDWNVTTIEDGRTMVGKTAWVGMGGSITGRGGCLIILDDFLKGRMDAESPKMRDKIWESFVNDMMTRRGSPCVVIVLATPWHIDDIFGRIEKNMAEDPNFPRFTRTVYPHKSDSYPSGYLFPEKFPPEWYESQESSLRPYNASGLLYCDPKARDGMLIKCVEGINWHFVEEKPEEFGPEVRAWDLASTEEQTIKDDPDYTASVRGAIKIDYMTLLNEYGQHIQAPIYSIYIDDISDCRDEAPRRNRLIQSTAVKDEGIQQGIESVAGYKDTYTTMADILNGICVVNKLNVPGDKVSKASTHLETPFDAGNVYVNKSIHKDKLKLFWDQLQGFPSAPHDDYVDALALMVGMCKDSGAYDLDALLG